MSVSMTMNLSLQIHESILWIHVILNWLFMICNKNKCNLKKPKYPLSLVSLRHLWSLVMSRCWNVFSPIQWMCFFLLVHCFQEAVSVPLCFAGPKSKHLSAGNASLTSVSLFPHACFSSSLQLAHTNNYWAQKILNWINQRTSSFFPAKFKVSRVNYHNFRLFILYQCI